MKSTAALLAAMSFLVVAPCAAQQATRSAVTDEAERASKAVTVDAVLDETEIVQLLRLARLSRWVGMPVDLGRGLCTLGRWAGPIEPEMPTRQDQILMGAWDACGLQPRQSGDASTRLVPEAVAFTTEKLAKLLAAHQRVQRCLQSRVPTSESCVVAQLGRPLTEAELKAGAGGARRQ